MTRTCQNVELDRALFGPPFVLVDADNKGVGTVRTLDEALAALAGRDDVTAVAGTLPPGVEALDIDPQDTGADPESGEAAAEELAGWCERHGLPHLVRVSGRPGGRHVVAVVPEALAAELRRLAACLAKRHGTAVTVRDPRTLRLLSSPHRAGLPCPVLTRTLEPADLDPAQLVIWTAKYLSHKRKRRKKGTGRGATRPRVQPTGLDETRSAKEFGLTIAAVRRGIGFADTWRLVSTPGAKSEEQGQVWFRAYLWFAAVTYVAAERGLSEPQAWTLARQACRSRADQLGLDGWRRGLWARATEQADRERNRRTSLPGQPGAEKRLTAEQRAEVTLLRMAFAETAEAIMGRLRVNGKRRKSVRAMLDALAPSVVTRGGSLARRPWAEFAAVSRSTGAQVIEQLTGWGVISKARAYAGGAKDSDAFLPGPQVIDALERIRSTRCVTPPPHYAVTHGDTDVPTLLKVHQAERLAFRLRTFLAEHCAATGEDFAECQHPAARTLRS